MNHASKLLSAILLPAILMLPAGPLNAQQASETAVSSAQLAGQQSYLKYRKPVYDIVIMGDVLGTGLWAGMNRVVEAEDRITVTGRIQDSSGLARPKLYNWQNAADKLLESRQFDIAAIMLGANDARDINTAEGVLKFGSAQWRKAYAEQLKALAAALKSHDIAVYWIGVPPMAREAYNAAMKVVADVERQVMADEGVRYLDLQLLLAGSDGGFTDSGDDGTGEVVRLRSRDGVKFITRGNDRLASELMKLVRADIAVADGGPAVPPGQVATPVPLTPEQLAALPSFSTERPDELADDAVDPANLPGPDYVEVARVSDIKPTSNGASGKTGLFDRMRANTPAGSAARKLFVDGVWPEGPADRFDAFAAPQQPASE
jgi:hypothetical protein